MRILEWLGGNDIGASINAIALAALGARPRNPSYPHDGDDFGRCSRLLAVCPEAKVGLDDLAKNGGAVWKALVARWSDIESAYLYDIDLQSKGNRSHTEYRCYLLMQSIIKEAHDASR